MTASQHDASPSDASPSAAARPSSAPEGSRGEDRPAPEVVLLDVVETLVSLEPVREALPQVGLGPEALDLLFARLLRDAFALAASGTPRAFPDVAASALAVLAPGRDPEPVLAAFKELPLHPDAAPAVARLRERGARVVALSNGTSAGTRALTAPLGLDDALSVEDAGTWKPRAEVYRYACDRLGVDPSRAALVAVHAWDVHGARAAGLRTGWCSRLEGAWAPAFDRADVEGADLLEVADRL